MNDPRADRDDDDRKTPLASISEQITKRLQAGEPVVIDDYVKRYPDSARLIRGLLPTLLALADFGHSVSRNRRPRRPLPDLGQITDDGSLST